jgi:beta-galactosidase/beta-glucuronidase
VSRLVSTVLAATALAALLAPAAAPAADGPPVPVSLDGSGWELHRDPANRGLASGWAAAGPLAGWEPVSVPSPFDSRPLKGLFRGTVGWYRLRFEAPRIVDGYRWALRFEGVRRRSSVWLNGRFLGRSTDPYNPFELYAVGLRPGGNELTLRVDNRKGDRPREGWWNWGGIVRPVRLVPRGRLVARDVALLPRVACFPARCDASVRVTGVVRNRTTSALGGRIDVRLTAPGGAVTESSIPVAPLARGRARVIDDPIAVTGPPALWSPATPNLYDAEIEVRAGGRLEQAETSRIGLRSVSVRRGHLELNGKPVKLYGASIQEDVPGRGPALTPADNDEIVAGLRALGANSTRAHYPLNENLLTKLDAAGIMVWNEAPVYHQNSELNTRRGRRAALEMVRHTILATRNHPSVVANSVANEPVSRPDAFRGSRIWLRQAARLARRLDPSRPVAVDILSYPRVPYQRTYRAFDLLGINSYYGWYEGNERHYTGNFFDLEPYLKRMHARYPRASMVMTEYGAEATRSGPVDEKGTYEFQDDYIRRVLDVVKRNEFMDGALYWTLREFAVKPDWLGGLTTDADPRPDAIHNKGLMSYDGVEKPAFSVLREGIAGLAFPG